MHEKRQRAKHCEHESIQYKIEETAHSVLLTNGSATLQKNTDSEKKREN